MPDFDPDAFIKKYGGHTTPLPAAPAAPTVPGTATAAAPDTPTDPAEDETPWSQRHDIEHGLERGGARFATSVVDLNKAVWPHIFPNLSQSLQTLVPESVKEKYREMREYGEQPSETTTEAIAAGAGEMAPYLIGGPEAAIARGVEGGVTRGIAGILPRAVPHMIPGPPTYAGAGQWVAGPAQKVGGGITRGAAKFARRVGRLTGGAAKTATSAGEGAVAGAIADPEHPGQGAEAGAIGGVVPGVGGAVMRSRPMRYLTQHLVPSGASSGAFMGLHALGLPGWLAHALTIPNIRWHSSPIGRRLSRVGPNIIDNHGNLVGTILNPAMTGAITSKGAHEMEMPSDEEPP